MHSLTEVFQTSNFFYSYKLFHVNIKSACAAIAKQDIFHNTLGLHTLKHQPCKHCLMFKHLLSFYAGSLQPDII